MKVPIKKKKKIESKNIQANHQYKSCTVVIIISSNTLLIKALSGNTILFKAPVVSPHSQSHWKRI